MAAKDRRLTGFVVALPLQLGAKAAANALLMIGKFCIEARKHGESWAAIQIDRAAEPRQVPGCGRAEDIERYGGRGLKVG
jgi:hypothetical protein